MWIVEYADYKNHEFGTSSFEAETLISLLEDIASHYEQQINSEGWADELEFTRLYYQNQDGESVASARGLTQFIKECEGAFKEEMGLARDDNESAWLYHYRSLSDMRI